MSKAYNLIWRFRKHFVTTSPDPNMEGPLISSSVSSPLCPGPSGRRKSMLGSGGLGLMVIKVDQSNTQYGSISAFWWEVFCLLERLHFFDVLQGGTWRCSFERKPENSSDLRGRSEVTTNMIPKWLTCLGQVTQPPGNHRGLVVPQWQSPAEKYDVWAVTHARLSS